jgi:hypothetical protein
MPGTAAIQLARRSIGGACALLVAAALPGCSGDTASRQTDPTPTPPPSSPTIRIPGTAILSWTPPTQNIDGSPLTDLAGYHIRYGNSETVLDQTIQLPNPSLATYDVTDLASGTWYFGVDAYNALGATSSLSNVASKTIP